MKSIGEKIADGIQKFYTAFINQRVLTTPEEVQANTNEKNLASAVVVGELYNNLMFPDGTHFYPDKQGDEYGYNTDAARGADTFRPFRPSDYVKFYGYFGGGAHTVNLNDNGFFAIVNAPLVATVHKLVTSNGSGDLFYYGDRRSSYTLQNKTLTINNVNTYCYIFGTGAEYPS